MKKRATDEIKITIYPPEYVKSGQMDSDYTQFIICESQWIRAQDVHDILEIVRKQGCLEGKEVRMFHERGVAVVKSLREMYGRLIGHPLTEDDIITKINDRTVSYADTCIAVYKSYETKTIKT